MPGSCPLVESGQHVSPLADPSTQVPDIARQRTQARHRANFQLQGPSENISSSGRTGGDSFATWKKIAPPHAAPVEERQMHHRDYGSAACIGVTVPQANPTVEPELQALAADGVSVLTARLQGSRTDSKNRLVGYLDNFKETLDAYDTAPLDAVAFACTGVSYIVGDERCEGELKQLSEQKGYPIFSAASAIRAALKQMGVQKIAVFAPYPEWLAEMSYVYWARAGFEVVASACAPMDPSDTRSVYKIRSVDIAANIAALDLSKAEVLLLTGTGMPTLKAIPGLSKLIGRPVISSNLCLAWAAMTACGLTLPAATATEPLYSGWQQRLRQ